MLYILQDIAELRHWDVAGLRWKHYDPNSLMLRQLVVATSYDKGHTKTKRTRYMPVHLTLAALPAKWKLRGGEMMGRSPMLKDLVVPISRCSATSAACSPGWRWRFQRKTPARLMATGALLHPLLQPPGKRSSFQEIQSGSGGNRTREQGDGKP